jgi:hypothetical protein
LALLLALTLMPFCTSFSQGAMSTSAEADLEISGKLEVNGTTKVDGWEANIVRTAIDSPVNNPTFGLLSTGNGDGKVNATEAYNYAQKAVTAGLVKMAFDMEFIKVAQDGKDIPATLTSMAFPDASGNVTGGSPLNVTFTVDFQTDFDQGVDTHKYSFSVNFHNISYSVRFKVPAGWDIGIVGGIHDKKIVNTDKESYVQGVGAGDGTKVTVEIKKESEWCCLVLGAIVVIIALIVIYILFRKYKKKREVSMTQPEYVTVEGDGHTEMTVVKPDLERRIKPTDRTFGKDYFDKEKKDGTVPAETVQEDENIEKDDK